MKTFKDIILRLSEFAALAVIILVFYFVEPSIKEFFKQSFSITPLIFYMTIPPIFLGVLIRLSDLIKRWGTQNRFDWIRFLIVVLPGIIIIAQTLIAIIFETTIWFKFMIMTDYVSPFIGIWVGAHLIDCIKGKESNKFATQ